MTIIIKHDSTPVKNVINVVYYTDYVQWHLYDDNRGKMFRNPTNFMFKIYCLSKLKGIYKN
jgi:hypothetical protein